MYMVDVPHSPNRPHLLVFLDEQPSPEECPFPVYDNNQFTPLSSEAYRLREGDARLTQSILARHKSDPDTYREFSSPDDIPETFAEVAGVDGCAFHSWASFKNSPLGSDVG